VRRLVETLERAGFETWAVGGAVRDVLLGVPSGDWDLATRARPKQVRKLFKRTVPLGVEHGTVGVLAEGGKLFEVTTFRRDVITTGRHAVVEFADRLEDDLARRDFTINAIAWHPLKDVLYDPFGGVDDLNARVLRTVGEPTERFAEDYLRVLRALRFAGRFALEIEPRTWRALRGAVEHLDILSRERVREELMKVLTGDPRPSRALELYRASGVLAKVAPELAAGVGAPAPGVPLPGLDAWRYGTRLAEAIPRQRALLRLAGLLQATAVEASEPGAPAHEAARHAAQLLIRLRFSNAQVDRVVGLVAAGPVPPADLAPAALRRWLSRVGPERLPDLARLWIARARALAALAPNDARTGRALPDDLSRTRALWSALRRELASKPPLAVGDLALDGRDLIRMGMKPGPHFRDVLDGLLERVLEDPSLNDPDRLAELVRKRLEEGGDAQEGSGP
jgi:tRNA nucleotidyltransferase (CCA-adding enzyme)